MHRKLHVDTLILIPTFKIYVFSYSRQTDRQDRRTDNGEINPVWAGYSNRFLQVKELIRSPWCSDTQDFWQ